MSRLVLVGLLLTACGGTYFSKPGSSGTDWKRDYYECRIQSSRPRFATREGIGAVANFAAIRDETELLDMCLEVRGWVKQ
jgi:hypothetical protein